MNLSSDRIRSNRPAGRRGVLLLSVLVGLAIVMLLVTAWFRTIGLERRYVRAAADRAQAELLAAAGLERARAQLAADPDFISETWRIAPEELGKRGGAVVTITVSQPADHPQARRVAVHAEFPDEGPRRARRTRTSTLQISPPRESS